MYSYPYLAISVIIMPLIGWGIAERASSVSEWYFGLVFSYIFMVVFIVGIFLVHF